MTLRSTVAVFSFRERIHGKSSLEKSKVNCFFPDAPLVKTTIFAIVCLLVVASALSIGWVAGEGTCRIFLTLLSTLGYWFEINRKTSIKLDTNVEMKLFVSKGNPHCVKVLAAAELTGIKCDISFVNHEGKLTFASL